MNERQYDMTGAWALNALDAEERARLEEYLAQDPAAADEARSLQETAGELARGLEPETPRPAVKDSLMAQIAQTRQLSPTPSEDEESGPTHRRESPTSGTDAHGEDAPSDADRTDIAPTASPAADAGTPDPAVVSLDRFRSARRRTRFFAVAAALLMVTTLAGVGLWSSERTAEQDARATIEAMESERAQEQAEQEMISTIMTAEDATTMTVPADTGGSLNLMYSREQGAMVLKPTDLPELPEGSAYQLWIIGDTVESAGMISNSGQMMMWDEELPETATLGLTIEPADGSEQPTTDPIAAGELT